MNYYLRFCSLHGSISVSLGLVSGGREHRLGRPAALPGRPLRSHRSGRERAGQGRRRK